MRAKFHNNPYKTVRGVALTRGTNCLYIKGEKWLSSQCGKSNKNILTIIPKPTCTSSYHEENICSFKPIGIKLLEEWRSQEVPIVYIEGEKWLSSGYGKSDKNVLTIIPKPHTHPHTMKKTHAKFQNNQYKTVRGVAPTVYILRWKTTKFTMWKKWQNNLTIISKPYAHLHTMKKKKHMQSFKMIGTKL